ncbi:MAG: hypothetical protein E7643_03510 [Ruminococcaceae bacterium]|nr:hypothetical protein [Oscillospiraceae bacterium]
MSEYRNDKEAAGEIAVRNKFVAWLDNFWYHYKWYVIVIAFFVLVFTVCFVQCVQKEDVDVPVVFAGAYAAASEEDYRWTEEKRNEIEEILEGLLEKSGVPGQSVGFLTYDVFTEEELRDKATEKPTNENETGEFSNSYYNTLKQNNLSEINSLTSYMGTGECSIYFVSEYVYTEKGMKNEMMPLSRVFGEEIPVGAYDECAVRLGDTELYQYYDAIRMMPADTLIVLRPAWVMGASSDAETYADYTALYRAIVEFKAP